MLYLHSINQLCYKISAKPKTLQNYENNKTVHLVLEVFHTAQRKAVWPMV